MGIGSIAERTGKRNKVNPWILAVTAKTFKPWWYLSLLVAAALAYLVFTLDTHPGHGLAHIAWIGVAVTLPVLFIVDLATKRLPDSIVIPAIQLVGGLYLVDAVRSGLTWTQVGVAFACGAGAYSVYYLIAVITRGLGLGDAKFAALLGFTLGATGFLPALFAVLILPGLLGIPVIVALIVKKKTHVAIPFGPLMAMSAAAVMVGFTPLTMASL